MIGAYAEIVRVSNMIADAMQPEVYICKILIGAPS